MLTNTFCSHVPVCANAGSLSHGYAARRNVVHKVSLEFEGWVVTLSMGPHYARVRSTNQLANGAGIRKTRRFRLSGTYSINVC